MASAFALPAVDFAVGGAVGDQVVDRQVLRLVGDDHTLVQALTSVAGSPGPQQSGSHQIVLFVISGSGRISCAGVEQVLTPRCGASVPADSEYVIVAEPTLELMRVEVIPHDGSAAHAAPFMVRSFDDASSGEATGGRDFQVLLDSAVGFEAGTLFVGNVPAGPPAPVHYHQYDEVICILDGEATVHIQGEQIKVRPGSCYRLPARILHQVENTGDGVLREIGFFVPEGTPAGAFLPDGTGAFPGLPFDTVGHRERWTVPQQQ